MCEAGAVDGQKTSETEFSGPDYLKAIFSLTRYSSLQDRNKAQLKTCNALRLASCTKIHKGGREH